MKIFHKAKDGGPESTVTGYWLIEAKSLFSVALLCFENGSRESYHSHAFNSISWVRGHLREEHHEGYVEEHRTGIKPVITRRSTFHRVFSVGRTWVFTIRGPWAKNWKEFDPNAEEYSTLENGRRVVARSSNINELPSS